MSNDKLTGTSKPAGLSKPAGTFIPAGTSKPAGTSIIDFYKNFRIIEKGEPMIEVKTNEEFKKEVLESQVPVIVDFWASWCQPCLVLGPIIEDLSQDFKDKVKVVKVNVDEARDLAVGHQIMSIPTVIFFKGGEIVDRSIGVVAKEILAEKLEALL